MAISTTFNTRDLSTYVEDCFKDYLNLRSNPLEEGEVGEEQGIYRVP